MRFIAVLAILSVIALAAQGADVQSCLTSGTYNLPGPTYNFGCNGYGNNVNIIWNLTSSAPLLFTFTSFVTEANYDKVTITSGGTTFGPYSGNTIPAPFITSSGLVIVQFISDGSNTFSGFVIVATNNANDTALTSSQPYQINTPPTTGGFLYYYLPAQVLGATFNLHASVLSYNGLQPPGIFIAKNRHPLLESFDYTNVTYPVAGTGSDYAFDFTLNSPPSGTYFIGVFLYGTTTSLTVQATWTYNIQLLSSGVKVTNNVTTTDYYQVKLPSSTLKLNVQFSRQVPGGYPTLYIGAGFVPSAQQSTYAFPTTQVSYVSQDIYSPYHGSGANPGTWIIAVESSGGATGYILQATWA